MMKLSIHDDTRPKVIVIAGPTASGKSTIGLELAQEVDGEIVQCRCIVIWI